MAAEESDPEGSRATAGAHGRAQVPGSARVGASLAIAFSLALQGLATTRVLCPPRALGALAPLRVACPPALWPFTDYPMYSQPHRAGDTLAWVEAWSVSPGAAPTSPGAAPGSLGAFRVLRAAPDEPWSAAFEREEERLRAERGAATLAFERHRLVLTRRGLVPDDGAGATPR